MPNKNYSKNEEKQIKKGNNESFVSSLMNNTPFVIALCIIIILLATLILVLCTKKIPKTKNGDEIIASIKGKTITAEDLYQQLKEDYATDALITIVDDYIADKEVKITKEDKKQVEEVVDYYKEYADYYGVDFETFLANYIGISGVTTEDEFYNYVLKDYKKSLAVTKFIGDKASKDELKDFYKKNYSDKLTVKHILIEVDADAEDQETAEKEAKEKAEKIIKKLQDTDKDKLNDKFDELCEKNSDDPATYSNGGLIEDFTKNDVVEEFFNASKELEDGKFTKEPVKTSYGYHVILKVKSSKADKFDDIIDDVKKAYAEEKLNSDANLQITAWADLRKSYKLSIEDDEVKKIYKNTIKVDSEKEEAENTENEEK